ncbi:hypothetical protein [Cronobacter sakazakii]|uniref:hypothetical protein n=1 Tax=Cronobacter sakazakii TaxID=28141 RepID=UPI001015E931|nr:hypothetical protein [Cronobacter sakazakii]EKK3978333.1 hypothetical protein [Cronobacter sakazakii]ELY3417175.1 hypothetical protein [Cronobacter sakazakii]ELY6147045.1 hypothetical protein [Cronobacter sakazakii]MBF4825193.1 hypothetical protein [Cronobacter sakazakii]HDK7352904.1 hypothetical protein [Cronobacter sakazakii]
MENEVSRAPNNSSASEIIIDFANSPDFGSSRGNDDGSTKDMAFLNANSGTKHINKFFKKMITAEAVFMTGG